MSEYERQYQDGSDPAILDVIDLQLIEPRPKGYQQENWLLDPQTYWGKVNRITWNDLPALQDPAAALWIDGHSTYNGLNDQIPLALAGALTTSLRLIHIDDLAIRVFRPGEAFGNNKRRVQGRFEHHGFEYRLWVTDPRYERTFLLEADGEYEVGECYLTISLGEALNNVCYKLIAAIIEP